MSIHYEPFRDDDAISAALDRYWNAAMLELIAESPGGDQVITQEQIAERALQIAKENARD